MRAFVTELLEHIHNLTPAELWAIVAQSGAMNSKHSNIIKDAISAANSSLITQPPVDLDPDCGIDGEVIVLDVKVTAPAATKADGKQADGATATSATASPADASRQLRLPHVSVPGVFAVADSALWAQADDETIEFLISSGVEKLWKAAYQNVDEVRRATAEPQRGAYSERIRARFVSELDAALNLTIPEGYAFRPHGAGTPIQEPNLMQRHVAADVAAKRRVGNWSAPGAGKTLSAIIASRTIGARLTVVCCPNAVVGEMPTRWSDGSGWCKAIAGTYPDSRIATKTLNPVWGDGDGPRWLVLNYETFQQSGAEAKLASLLDREQVDFVVIDEIHYAKQRGDDPSIRRRLVQGMIAAAAERNPNIAVLGMSATPVINGLAEGRSLIELVTGVTHDDLGTTPSIANAMVMHQRLVTLGSRYIPDYRVRCDTLFPAIELDYETLLRLSTDGRHNPLVVEQILTEHRLDTIADHVTPKTLIYTHYVDGITDLLAERLRADGWKVGLCTGADKSGLDGFIYDDVDVLIGSSAISTGIDGLQQVCRTMIVNALPWTNAEYEQLLGRIVRQGQTSSEVTVVVPQTFANINGEEWSWCKRRWLRIQWKRSLADAAVDGVVPEGMLMSPQKVVSSLMKWLEQLQAGKALRIERPAIVAHLERAPEPEISTRIIRFGEFATLNSRWNHASSGTTAARLHTNPEEWHRYHELFGQVRRTWAVNPVERFAADIAKMRRPRLVADLGCGEADLAAALAGTEHTVVSFDHVAVNNTVTACDIANLPVDDGAFDIAVLSLALMGSNASDYLREAWRTLDHGGQLFLAEPSTRLPNLQRVERELRTLGFDVSRAYKEGTPGFTFIQATRSSTSPAPDATITFGEDPVNSAVRMADTEGVAGSATPGSELEFVDADRQPQPPLTASTPT